MTRRGLILRERVPAEPPLLERAGDVVLDQDVRGPGEALEEGLAFGPRQVERDRALAAPVDFPPELAEGLGPGADGVAAPGIFDLEDVGAEVGQHRGQHAAGDEARAVHDAEVGERPRGLVHAPEAAFRASSFMYLSSASTRSPSASFSVRPVTVTARVGDRSRAIECRPPLGPARPRNAWRLTRPSPAARRGTESARG